MVEKLTPKQQAFCREYIVDFNGTQAAIRAGYSPRTANEQAVRMLANVSIQVFLQSLIDARAERLDRRGDEVLARLWQMADFQLVGDVVDLVDGEFVLKPADQWSESSRRVVRSVRVNEDGFSIKVCEAMSALVQLMQHYGLSSDFNTAIACLRN